MIRPSRRILPSIRDFLNLLSIQNHRGLTNLQRDSTSRNIFKITDQLQTVFLIVIVRNCFCKRLIRIVYGMCKEIQKSFFIEHIRLKPNNVRSFFRKNTGLVKQCNIQFCRLLHDLRTVENHTVTTAEAKAADGNNRKRNTYRYR